MMRKFMISTTKIVMKLMVIKSMKRIQIKFMKPIIKYIRPKSYKAHSSKSYKVHGNKSYEAHSNKSYEANSKASEEVNVDQSIPIIIVKYLRKIKEAMEGRESIQYIQLSTFMIKYINCMCYKLQLLHSVMYFSNCLFAN